MDNKDHVTIVEVGPRDGLQYESVFFPTARKIALVDLLSKSGLKKIEVTSFVHPKIIPHLKDAVEVIAGINKQAGVTYSALVPNLKGCERALTTKIDEIALFVSASETHNGKNVGMDIQASLDGFVDIAKAVLDSGRTLRGYIVTAFGCPYEGKISFKTVSHIIQTYSDIGVSEISLGDTTGMANPVQVRECMTRLSGAFPSVRFAAHFHNSRGLGLANAFAAYEAGIRVFDSSIAGLGGCPTAEGAMGNIPTEDAVNMFEEMGADTQTDFECLMEAAALVKDVLDTDLPSFTSRRGRPNWHVSSEN